MKVSILLFVMLIGLSLAGCATSDATGKRLGMLETKLDILTDKVDALEQKQGPVEAAHEYAGYSKGETGESLDDLAADIEKSSKKNPKSDKVVLAKKDIQLALKKAGFYKGPIDGKIGNVTKRAIKKFQGAHGLKADGMVGQNTSNLLAQYLGR